MKLGEIRRGRDVGAAYGYHKVQWSACDSCGTARWVMLKRGRPQSRICAACRNLRTAHLPKPRGAAHPNWRGGRSIGPGGYVTISLAPTDRMFSMADERGRVREHRLVMAHALGRALLSDEEVHHKNDDPSDNSIENLELLTRAEHARRHGRKLHKALLSENAELRARLRLYE